MRYDGELPSMRLDTTALRELEKIFSNSVPEKEDFKQEIEIKYDGWSKAYHSISELIEDPLKPNEVKEIDWSLGCSEGNIRMYTLYGSPTQVRIVGKDKWAKNVQTELYEFAKKYKSLTGKIANNFAVLSILLISGILVSIEFGMAQLETNVFYGLINIFIGCIFVIFWFVQLFSSKWSIPYLRIEFKENTNRKRLEQITIAIIASMASYIILYIVNYILAR